MKTFTKDKCFRWRNLVRCAIVTSLVCAGLSQGASVSPAVLAPAEPFALEPWWQAPDRAAENILDQVPPVFAPSLRIDPINQAENRSTEINATREATRRGTLPCRPLMDRVPRQNESRSKSRTAMPAAKLNARNSDGAGYVVPFGASQHCEQFAALCNLLDVA